MKPRPKNRYTAVIDATELFESEEIKEYDFGDVDIEEVQICEMGVKEVDGEIRYKSVGGFSLTSMEELQTRDVVLHNAAKTLGDVDKTIVHDLKGPAKTNAQNDS